jgi:hypothetical protein
MSHDEKFPQSAETPEQRSARAVEALKYEEKAGLGFRRRRIGEASGDPYAIADQKQYDINRVMGRGEVLGNSLAGICAVLGATSLLYRPLLLSTIAAICGICGLIPGGESARTARIALIVASFGFFFGMLFALIRDTKVF